MVHYTQKGLDLPDQLTQQQQEIAFGVLLGDSWLQTLTQGRSYRMRFEQGNCHKEYIDHLAKMFYPWVQKAPTRYQRSTPSGSSVITWRCQSVTHQAFSPLAQVIYPHATRSKTLPSHYIEKYVTPQGLAYWFMDDGGKSYYGTTPRYGLNFHTQGFQPQQVEWLAEGLEKTYGLKTWVKLNKQRFIIVISGESYLQFLEICGQYTHPSMYPKLPCGGLKLGKTVKL